MATTMSIPSSGVSIHKQQPDLLLFGFGHHIVTSTTPTRRPHLLDFFEDEFSERQLKTSVLHLRVHAVKLPDGVVLPKVEPKLKAPVIGFTQTAEIWNSRACMIGLIGTFIVELIINKGILEVIGLEIGKGLDIPL